MATSIAKISDTELEFTEDPEKYVMKKELIEERLALFKANIKEYENLLKLFD